MLIEVMYCLLWLERSAAAIMLRNLQIKDGSYIMVNPAYIMVQGVATYIMSLKNTPYFSMSSLAAILIFQANFALTIIYVYNPFLKVRTFWSEYLTCTFLINVGILSYRYVHFRREIELFILNKRFDAERNFFKATMHQLPQGIIFVGKNPEEPETNAQGEIEISERDLDSDSES